MIFRRVLPMLLLEVLVIITQPDTTIKVQAFVTTTQSTVRTTTRVTTAKANRNLLLPLTASLGTLIGSKENTIALDWSFLDGVYLVHCPNGDIDGSRMESSRETLSNVNLLDKLQVKEFDTDDEDRIRGCYTSHLTVYRDILKEVSISQQRRSPGFDFFSAFQKNVEKDDVDVNVLILEDNVALSGIPVSQAAIDSIASVVKNKKNIDWDVIHLSFIPYVPSLTVSRTEDSRIVKVSTGGVGSALGTTAYIINSKAMKKLVAEDDARGFTVPIPDAMANLFGESRYASNPTIFVRAPTTKSLVNPQLDDLRSILFQPAVTLLAQQLLVSTGLSTNMLLPLVILALVMGTVASAITSIESGLYFIQTGTFDRPWIIPLASVTFSIFSLLLIMQGILLAPKQDESKI